MAELKRSRSRSRSPIKKQRRKQLRGVIREQIWDKWIGKDKGTAICPICETNEIRQTHYIAGHIIAVANGGEDTVDNIRPICNKCNLYMEVMNMDEYKIKYRPELQKYRDLMNAYVKTKPDFIIIQNMWNEGIKGPIERSIGIPGFLIPYNVYCPCRVNLDNESFIKHIPDIINDHLLHFFIASNSKNPKYE